MKIKNDTIYIYPKWQLMRILFLVFSFVNAQEEMNVGGTTFKTMRPAKKKDSITFTAHDYKIISYERDTTAVDTSLTIQKYYRMNEVQKDMFGYMPFSNMAQPYNALMYDFGSDSYFPSMGANAKKMLYLSPGQINYYRVPTPLTEFTFQSGIEQGQFLNTLFTVNLKPNLNIFIAYKGLRSLGRYQRILVSNGNFRMGFSYESPNKKYTAFAHYATHDITSYENGGIASIEQFTSGDSQYRNRAVLDVFLADAENKRDSKRYFLQHDYDFLNNRKDSTAYKQIRMRHKFEYETEYYYFDQATALSSYFGAAYVPLNIRDIVRLKKMTNTIGTEVELPYLGKTFVYGSAYMYNYFFKNAYYISGVLQPHQIKGTDVSIGAEWDKRIGGLHIEAQGEQTLVGKMTGTKLHGTLSYHFNDRNKVKAGVHLLSTMPDFNYLLYQSDYKNYNWYHFDDFNKVNTQTLFGNFETQWLNADVSLSNINNYTFLEVQTATTNDRPQSLPSQYSGNIQYLKIKLQRTFELGKFGFDNTVLFQRVVQNDPILNVPDFVTRNTVYYATHLFKKAMYVQVGVGLNYFTSYHSNRYNPLLAEFEVQSTEKTGNFPMIDAFFNAKVRTMRIFLKAEHTNGSFTGRNYFAAPAQPYRDFHLRFGIVWDIFS
ncbi:MAG: putative porin [Capnocytophaga sp.]|nr:putative porin [Capnocytophaga sp.]